MTNEPKTQCLNLTSYEAVCEWLHPRNSAAIVATLTDAEREMAKRIELEALQINETK